MPESGVWRTFLWRGVIVGEAAASILLAQGEHVVDVEEVLHGKVVVLVDRPDRSLTLAEVLR